MEAENLKRIYEKLQFYESDKSFTWAIIPREDCLVLLDIIRETADRMGVDLSEVLT